VTIELQNLVLLPSALPAIGNRVRGDPEESGDERNAAPLETAEIRERLMEHVGGQVLGRIAVVNVPRDERVDALEVVLLELRKAAGVSLRRLNQKLLTAKSGVALLSNPGNGATIVA